MTDLFRRRARNDFPIVVPSPFGLEKGLDLSKNIHSIKQKSTSQLDLSKNTHSITSEGESQYGFLGNRPYILTETYTMPKQDLNMEADLTGVQVDRAAVRDGSDTGSNIEYSDAREPPRIDDTMRYVEY